MTDDFSAAADFATGAIMASAVEPSSGAAAGSDVSPCHSCGQKVQEELVADRAALKNDIDDLKSDRKAIALALFASLIISLGITG
jgi:hypothetical protein